MQMQTQMQMMPPFVWGELTSGGLGLLPPPLWGRGGEGGDAGEIIMAPPAQESRHPHPQPLPTRGRGAHRARGDADAEITVVIAGLDPAIHPLRKEVVTKRMDPRVKPAGDL
jgi:hypothetical protein